jgi:hypothetical protein
MARIVSNGGATVDVEGATERVAEALRTAREENRDRAIFASPAGGNGFVVVYPEHVAFIVEDDEPAIPRPARSAGFS